MCVRTHVHMRASMYRQALHNLDLADLGVEKTMFHLDRDSGGAGVAYGKPGDCHC